MTSRSPHGERGLKSPYRLRKAHMSCRSPHGERGLKFSSAKSDPDKSRSLSSWRAWIEIISCAKNSIVGMSRSPHGERGLK